MSRMRISFFHIFGIILIACVANSRESYEQGKYVEKRQKLGQEDVFREHRQPNGLDI
jgi:hypothetical protein